MKHLLPLVDVITRAMRDQLVVVVGAINARLDDFEQRLRAIPRGDKGERGEQGSQGEKGAPGESIRGDRGPAGEKGDKGEPGASIKGDKGEQGPTGPKGDVGASITGERGLAGQKGDPGQAGPTGPQGERGIDAKAPEVEPIIAAVLQRIPPPKDGQRGEQGPAGESIKGDTGARGLPGIQGPAGESIKGDKGDTGESIRGEVGPIGPSGETGARGEPGESIKGDQGERGIPGESIRGDKGERGEPGLPPSPEELEKYVEREFSKFALGCERRLQELADRELQRAIAKFPVPKDGANGKDGRDALDLQDLDLTFDDDGFINFTFKRGELEKFFRLYVPTVSDKGVYKQGVPYLRQNGVTHNGCFWISQVDNPSEGPGVGSQWRMAVKSGRNGTNGSKGDTGPQGPPGQDRRYE